MRAQTLDTPSSRPGFDAAGAAAALLALALPVSIAATNIALGLLTAAALLSRPDPSRLKRPAFYALLAYVAAAALSAAACPAPAESLRAVLKDAHKLWALGLFLLAVRPSRRVALSLGAGFAFVAGVGVWQKVAGGLPRAHAFVHPVTFGEIMAFAVLGALCFAGREDGRRRGAALALAALCACALALSGTRAAAVGVAAGLLAAGLLDRRLWRWLVLFAAAGAGAFLLRRHGSVPLLESRGALWDVAWRMFKDHPWLGAGPGRYRALFPQYHTGVLEGEFDWGSAHDLYLHQAAERGGLGLAALAAFLGALLGGAWRRARRAPNAWTLWAFSAVAAFLVMNLTEVALQVEQAAALFLFIWTLGNV